MTIIEPKKNKLQFNALWILAIGLVLVEVALTVYAYSQNVRLSHELWDVERNIESLRISTTDFKNQIYANLDLQNVDQLAEKLGLVKERKPEYLSANR